MADEIDKIISSKDTRPHFERIKHLILEEGAVVDQVGNDNWTLLIIAAYCGDLDCVKFLLENGANIQHECKHEYTPLHNAAFGGHLDVVKCLIQHGANIEHQCKHKSTPLRHAACEGHFDVVKYLIQHGAFIDAVDKWNDTPLWWASQNGHVDVVKYLLDMGADHSIADDEGKTPLMIAEEWNKTQVADILRKHSQQEVEKKLLQQQQEEKEEREKKEEINDDPHCFDGIVIQSSDEIKLIIAHLEKQLNLFFFSTNFDHEFDSRHHELKQWLENNKKRCDELVKIHQEGKLPLLENMASQIDLLHQEMNQYARQHFTDWSTKIGHHNVKDDASIVEMGLNYHDTYKSKISTLYSVLRNARRALEQRHMALGHL